MSGLWCEHFLEYANTTQLLDGVFASVGAWSITAAGGAVPAPRTGAKWLQSSSSSFGQQFRRIFGGMKTGAGVGFRYYCANLPAVDGSLSSGEGAMPFGWLNASGLAQMSVFLGSDGAVIICRGGPGAVTVLARSAPCITARTWQYVEAKCVPDPSAGSVEVRVNGVTVLTYTGDTDPQASGEVSQFFHQGPIFDLFGVADLHAWDTTPGNGPSDFTGNVGVLRRELSGDTATADWTLSGGSTGYTLLIDQDDATYIDAPSTTLKSAFQAGNLPAGTSGILYQQVKFRGQKTDSADCDVAPSMISSSVETAVTGQPMTSLDTWRWGVFGDDPNTSAPWTLANANASDVAVTRTL